MQSPGPRTQHVCSVSLSWQLWPSSFCVLQVERTVKNSGTGAIWKRRHNAIERNLSGFKFHPNKLLSMFLMCWETVSVQINIIREEACSDYSFIRNCLVTSSHLIILMTPSILGYIARATWSPMDSLKYWGKLYTCNLDKIQYGAQRILLSLSRYE